VSWTAIGNAVFATQVKTTELLEASNKVGLSV
jgi:hypothetical protein